MVSPARFRYATPPNSYCLRIFRRNGSGMSCDRNTQERIVGASNPTSHQMMFWQNFWAAVWLFAASAASGQGVAGTQFFYKHPEALKDGFFFCLASAVGQNFIFYTVRNLSALTCTTITTTRKFVTLLVSLVFFKHSLDTRQALAVVLVFTGIIWETVYKHQKKQAKLAAEKARAKAEKTE
uniref:Sugar phosphate transporter domain-containing protein n=1 Tax=Rhodosorus marinus TaxID=101924 RepID=A0A7S2ZQK7_9RHOD|mmetsp:Transcript_26725/g.103836  ORF Transcript_26725/g.103836 Transcript_26725/m.103836 type:complete len:181 (+) Transcript_26725:879-1421(+)